MHLCNGDFLQASVSGVGHKRPYKTRLVLDSVINILRSRKTSYIFFSKLPTNNNSFLISVNVSTEHTRQKSSHAPILSHVWLSRHQCYFCRWYFNHRPLFLTRISFDHAWIRNHIHYKMWDEIICPSLRYIEHLITFYMLRLNFIYVITKNPISHSYVCTR